MKKNEICSGCSIPIPHFKLLSFCVFEHKGRNEEGRKNKLIPIHNNNDDNNNDEEMKTNLP